MNQTILLVEDNEDNLTVYRRMLEHFGYPVLVARAGDEGIRIARESRPALILMDIALPVINGWEAIQQLQADDTTAGIPIVALTAHALAADRLKAEELGCTAYLAKPIEPRKVVEQVQRLLD